MVYEGKYNAKKYMKKYSVSTVMREMGIKATMKYQNLQPP